jgi:hypothetical protein
MAVMLGGPLENTTTKAPTSDDRASKPDKQATGMGEGRMTIPLINHHTADA